MDLAGWQQWPKQTQTFIANNDRTAIITVTAGDTRSTQTITQVNFDWTNWPVTKCKHFEHNHLTSLFRWSIHARTRWKWRRRPPNWPSGSRMATCWCSHKTTRHNSRFEIILMHFTLYAVDDRQPNENDIFCYMSRICHHLLFCCSFTFFFFASIYSSLIWYEFPTDEIFQQMMIGMC